MRFQSLTACRNYTEVFTSNMRVFPDLCILCGLDPPAPSSSYCTTCGTAKKRKWRNEHRLEGEARKKMNCRTYLHVYIRRGKVKKGKCEVCGSDVVEAHHDDYNKPLQVRWFCTKHHRQYHKHKKAAETASATVRSGRTQHSCAVCGLPATVARASGAPYRVLWLCESHRDTQPLVLSGASSRSQSIPPV